MVKGIAKRVIVVRSPNPQVFEEAIFIVRDDAAKKSGVSAQDLLREAQDTANAYLQNNVHKKRGCLCKLPPLVLFSLGAGLTGLLWAVCAFF